MNISEPFIRRPVATLICMAALVIFGWGAYQSLPVSELPNIDFPTLVVTAVVPGASPETMASIVATPLEKQFSSIDGLDSMNSVSSLGVTRITLQFVLEKNIDVAVEAVQTGIAQASKDLPTDMTTPPTIRKSNPAASPILYLACTAEHLPLTELNDFLETYVTQRISMIQGVADVNVYGAQQYAVRIHLNPNALANRGLTVESVADSLAMHNTHQPSGTLQTAGHTHLIRDDFQRTNAKEFSDVVVAAPHQVPIHLKDVGTAEDSVANDKAATWFQGKRSIVLAVDRQPDANTVTVAKAIQDLLPILNKQLPKGAHLDVFYDRSQFIGKAISDVEYTLLFAGLLVVIVVFLFLKHFSMTLITVLALPISVIGTYGVMYLCHFNLDNISLMGLVLAVGFVIDDAVVVLENIVRHFEQGVDKVTASLQGSGEVCFTVVSMTLSLAAVFIPILFMGGLIGRLFNEFAIVVGSAILLSGCISLTFTPMLCSRLLPNTGYSHTAPTLFESFFIRIKEVYIQSLRWSLGHPRLILLLTLGLFIITGYLLVSIPKGFIPSQDADLISGSTQAVEGTPFADFVSRQQTAAAIVLKNPNVQSLISSVGQGSGGMASTTLGQLGIHLKPRQQRTFSADEVIQQLRTALQKSMGLQIFLQNPPAIRLGSLSSSGNYQYVLQGTSLEILVPASKKMEAAFHKIPGILDVHSEFQANNPEIRLHLLKDKADLFGITPQDIETALYTAYGERQISTIMTPAYEYKVIVDIDPKYQQSFSDLNALYINSKTGPSIPLTSLVEVEEGVGPLSITHYNQLPAITLSFNLSKSVSLEEVTQQIDRLAQMSLPANITGVFAGTAKTFQASLHDLPLLLFFTVLVIYMILAILYEHFLHPLTILTSLPLAIFGALMVLILFKQPLDIFGFIGLIMLVGLVKKNSIMMVDFALEAIRLQKLSPFEAILQACSIRFRPIMMTTLAALVATFPIALGLGAGGEARQSLGIAVVGGLLFSQIFTLYVTPLFYLIVETKSLRKWTELSGETS